MSESADVVIIGGGIVGSSIAWHLTEGGCNNVMVMERETQQGKGSTGKRMGGVRAQFATEVNIRMSLYSIPFFRAFDERMGYPSGYRPQGYLFVATSPRHMDYLRANFERQTALGLEAVRLLDAGEVIPMAPQIRPDDIVRASCSATDGFVDPYSVMKGFMRRASDSGARLGRGVEVTGIDVDSSGISAVRTNKGNRATRVGVHRPPPLPPSIPHPPRATPP